MKTLLLEIVDIVLMVQVVEITKGSKVKYELDKKTGLIKVRKHHDCSLSSISIVISCCINVSSG